MRLLCCLSILTSTLLITACNTANIRDVPVATTPTADHSSRHPTGTGHTQTVKRADAARAPEPELDHRLDQESALPLPVTTYADIWDRLRDNLVLDRHTHRNNVTTRLGWYSRNQEYLDRVAERARPYIHYIMGELETRNMPADLALLPIVESAYHPFAYSPSNASGLWQFIPGTGKLYGLKQNWWYDGRRDVVAATQAALDYLEKLHHQFNGDWLLALAAYNSGERNVARAIKRNQTAGKKTDFWSLRLPRETRGYVPSLLAVAELVANPDKHGITWQGIPNTAYFKEIATGGQIDLAMAAELAELSMDEIYTLNPAFNRWATDPDGPHRLLIPVTKQELFRKGMEKLPVDERINWTRHIIKGGDSLGLLARRYHTSVATLKQANGLRGNLIREGRSLLIPTSKQPMKYYTLSLDSRRFRGLKKTGTGEKYIYTVRRGDTLWDIGRNYSVSVNNLCSWNGISSRSILRPGQQLSLWLSDDGQTIAANTSGTATERRMPAGMTADTGTGPISYVVRKGDSLWLISKRFGTTVTQLMKWNKLIKNKPIHPGQKLVLHIQEV